MSSRPRAVAVVAVLAFLALAMIPLATADHAFSHRYIVYGRVLDAADNPVPGLTVDLGYQPPFEPEGPCSNQPGTDTEAFGPTRTSPVTNQFGEFMFCFHTHAMSRSTPGTGVLSIAALGVEREFEFDGFMRYSTVVVKLETTQGSANTTILDEFYTVQGRAWRPAGGDVRVEGIRVHGDTLHNLPINITFGPTGEVFSTTTNSYGDFSLRIPVTERPTTGTITATISNETFTAPIDATSGTTTFRIEAAKVSDPFVTKFLVGLGITAAVVVGGGALWFGGAKMRAAREEQKAREGSTRKRANR